MCALPFNRIWNRRLRRLGTLFGVLGVILFVIFLIRRWRSPKTRILIDRLCSPSRQTCYEVVDTLVYVANESMVERQLVIAGESPRLQASAFLIPNGDGAFSRANTKTWRVEHTMLPVSYSALMAAGIFMTEFFMRPKEESLNGLIVGARGATVELFLRKIVNEFNMTVVETDPLAAEATRRWFGVVDDAKRKTLFADPVDFIRKASFKKEKYDAIWLDDIGTSYSMIPGGPLRADEVVDNLAVALVGDGVLVVNTYCPASDIVAWGQMDDYLELLHDRFAICVAVRFSGIVNRVVACQGPSRNFRPSIFPTVELYKHRFEEFTRHTHQPHLRDLQIEIEILVAA